MSFGGLDPHGTPRPMSEINTTPLVDVMLVLLVIFIVTAPLLTHTVPVDLPTISTAATPEKPDVITLSLTKHGVLFWNDTPVNASELTQRLTEAGQRTPLPELHLRADRDTRYQKIAEIMTAAQKAGIQKLGFVSQPQQ